jgi:hypothetical protein
LRATLFVFILLSIAFEPKAQEPTVGLLQYSENAAEGYTLFAPMNSKLTFLIDNCGRIINQWESNYFPGASVYLLENGDLLRTGALDGIFPAGALGGVIERFDWNGNLNWRYIYASENFHQHHDIEPLPNGNILLLSWDKISADSAIALGRNPELLQTPYLFSEQIVEIQPLENDSASIIWEWKLLNHIVQDFDIDKPNFGDIGIHYDQMDFNFLGLLDNGDWVHANSIDYNAALDQILLSFRNSNEIIIIDHSTSTTEAASDTGGNSSKGGRFLYRWGNPIMFNQQTTAEQQLFNQHDAHWIPEGYPNAGKIMVFNNGANRTPVPYSSVEIIESSPTLSGLYEFDMESGYAPIAPDWTFTAASPSDFLALFVSGAQQLLNGNILICNGALGHFFEVDSNSFSIWSYQNPAGFTILSQGDPVNPISSANRVFRCERYAPDYPAFEGRNLEPGLPVELNPWTNDCELTNLPIPEQASIEIFPNPTYGEIYFSNVPQGAQIKIFTAQGQLLLQKERGTLIFSNHPQGIYFYGIEKDGRVIKTGKFIKH